METIDFINRKIMDDVQDKKISINTPYYKGNLLVEEVWLIYNGIKLKFKNKKVKSLTIIQISEFKKEYLLEIVLDKKHYKISLEEFGDDVVKNVAENIGIAILFREYFINERMMLRHQSDCNGVPGKNVGKCCLVHREIYETRLNLILKASEISRDSKYELLGTDWWRAQGIYSN